MMDGGKRETEDSKAPYSGPIDLGTATPPWCLPPIYHQESALRYTQTPEAERTINPQVLHRRSATQPPSVTTWTTLNEVSQIQIASKRAPGPTSLPPPQPQHDSGDSGDDLNESEDDELECHVDSRDGGDSVYMINAVEGSWSSSLPSENDPQVQATLPFQAVQALKKMKEAQEAAAQKQHSLAAVSATTQVHQLNGEAGNDTPGARQLKLKWQNDLHLRNIMRGIKQKIGEGGILTLERLGTDTTIMRCSHPLCLLAGQLLSPGSYYVTLDQPRQSAHAEQFCLTCLEGLWNGEGMMMPFPNPQARDSDLKPLRTKAIPGLDGIVDDSMVATRMAAVGSVTAASSVTSVSAPSTTISLPSRSVATTDYSATSLDERSTSRETDEQTDTPHIQSPSLRSYASRRCSVTREADNLALGFGEAFFDGQVKVAKKRGEVDSGDVKQTGARRSARLHNVLNEQVQVEVNTPTSPTSGLTTALNSTHISKQSDVDSVASEIAKSDRRLEEMYERRDALMTTLSPGDHAAVKLRKTAKDGPNARYVNLDMFGIQYTDLLAEDKKYATTQTSPGVRTSLTLQPLRKPSFNELVRPSEMVTRYLEEQEARWCHCHGVDDGREMLQCANEKCLVGWYHIACTLDDVTEADDDDGEDWLCALCVTLGPNASGVLTRPEQLEKNVVKVFTPDYAKGRDERPYGLGISLDSQHAQQAFHTLRGEVSNGEIMMQVDGPSDLPDANGQHSASPPQALLTNEIPNSLLTSKHAPPPEDLALYLATRQTTKSPTPTFEDLPETPGGPYTPRSTTSDGEWRSPPTRFQHLASFIQPGGSLDEMEKAVVQVWKAASKEQLHWQQHMETAQALRTCFADLWNEDEPFSPVNKPAEEDTSDLEEGEIDENVVKPARTRDVAARSSDMVGDDVEFDDDESAKSRANVSVPECRGKDLSAVLAVARRRIETSE